MTRFIMASTPHAPSHSPSPGGPAPDRSATEDHRTAAGTVTIDRPDTRELTEPGDAERFAHYVKKEKILESAMTGEPVIALCGKVWVPGRDPNKFPVCPACKEILDGVFGPEGGDGE